MQTLESSCLNFRRWTRCDRTKLKHSFWQGLKSNWTERESQRKRGPRDCLLQSNKVVHVHAVILRHSSRGYVLEISKMRLRSGGVAMRGRITTQSLRSLDDRGRPLVLHKEEGRPRRGHVLKQLGTIWQHLWRFLWHFTKLKRTNFDTNICTSKTFGRFFWFFERRKL